MAWSERCSHCNAPADPSAKFCAECGTDLVRSGVTTRILESRTRRLSFFIVLRAVAAIALVGLGWLLGSYTSRTPAAVSREVGVVHVQGGRPTFTDQSLSLEATGALTGLEDQDAEVVLDATGTARMSCTNPSGRQPRGQNKPNKGHVTLTGSQTISAGEIKNGNATFDLATTTAAERTARELGCPNNKWSATITDVSFTSATITVLQHGNVVLRQTFPQ